jgi:hypothetical protein
MPDVQLQAYGTLQDMSHLASWRTVVQDRSDFLGGVLRVLEAHGIRYWAVDGVAVNAYAEPVVTMDLHLVVAVDDLERATSLMEGKFRVARFEHSINVRDPGSGLQVQFQLDGTMADYVDRAEVRNVLDVEVPVAAPSDLIRAKVAAASDPTRRPSKRQKDLADISRLLEAIPALAREVPVEIRERLVR